MHCVVTGGAGFIGSAICSVLEERNVGSTAVIDALQGEQWLNIAKRSLHALVAPRDTWAYLRDCPEDTAVIHMGARTTTTDIDTAALAEINVKLTVDLFDYCADQGWPFVYASSASVYGVGNDQSDDDASLSKHRPLNAYAWSKLLADRMIVERSASKRPPFWAGLRLFNVYGPAEAHKGDQRSFVTKCLDSICTGRPITLFRGSEAFKRDWVYVADVAHLVVSMLSTANSLPSGVYNVGSGESVSFIEVASICIEASGKITPISMVPFPDHLYGHYQSLTLADTSKLTTVMPFKFHRLRQGAALAWGFAQRDGLSRVP